ncbi:MAG: NAD-dependent deacylase [Gaiellaceae bacterium]
MSTTDLASLIVERQPCVVLTGAGISTESGIPDFRSPTGIWADVDPVEVASIDAFRRDPGRVWEFYGRRLGMLGAIKPNAGHHALVELERRGLVTAVITQNVDGLHQRAGSRDVVEVHGSLARAVCPECGASVSIDDVRKQLDTASVPLCITCSTPLKPGVVMFGELLPAAAIDRATSLAQAAGLVLVVGSSLEVWPIAGLPLEAAAFAIVNLGPTALDRKALLKIEGGAGETLAAVVDALPKH